MADAYLGSTVRNKQKLTMETVRFFFLFVALSMVISCAGLSSFESPNSLRNMTGTLFLTNGKAVDGRLVIQVGSLFGSDVKVYAEGDKKPMNFNLGDVQGYNLRGDYYALKEKKGSFGVGKRLSFMKRLTPADSRIHLYEEMEKVTESTKGNTSSRNRYETEYYLQLPDETYNDVYPLSSSKFVPAFDEKMSRVVKDCPSLAQKIAAKESGYFYAQVSLFNSKRVEVLMNIIREYNRCGK